MSKANHPTSHYGKWDCAETAEVAFEKVRTGEWSKERFLDWHAHHIMEIQRDLSEDASI